MLGTLLSVWLNIPKNMCSTSNKCLKVFHRLWVIFGTLLKSSAIFDNLWNGLGGCWMCFKMFGWYSLILEGFSWFSELLVKDPIIFSYLGKALGEATRPLKCLKLLLAVRSVFVRTKKTSCNFHWCLKFALVFYEKVWQPCFVWQNTVSFLAWDWKMFA